jgi:hypothetical protein
LRERQRDENKSRGADRSVINYSLKYKWQLIVAFSRKEVRGDLEFDYVFVEPDG